MNRNKKVKTYPCIIAVAEDGFKCLVDSGKGEFIGHEIFESIDLDVELNNGIGLPNERGVYTIDIAVETILTGDPLNGQDFDLRFSFDAKNIKKVNCFK